MRAGSSRRIPGLTTGLCFAMLIAPWEPVQAQAPPPPVPPSGQTGPAVPDGITVTPTQPLLSPPGYGGGDGAGTARERDLDAERQPPDGCRYREQKLELIV